MYYSGTRRKIDTGWENPPETLEYRPNRDKNSLLLQVYAAADFYTNNLTLMNSPPLVLVDLSKLFLCSRSSRLSIAQGLTVLDPYLGDILPFSLLPTSGYIVLITLASWCITGTIWQWLHNLSQIKHEADNKTHFE